MTQLYGSMDAVIKIIARELGDAKVLELSAKYQLPEKSQE
jgi:stringent starvation protein B